MAELCVFNSGVTSDKYVQMYFAIKNNSIFPLSDICTKQKQNNDLKTCAQQYWESHFYLSNTMIQMPTRKSVRNTTRTL